MPDHPFTESSASKLTGSLLILLVMFAQWVLLIMYTGVLPAYALIDSMLSTGLLAVAGYAAWYLTFFVNVWQAQIIIALLVQAICLGVCYSILSLSDLIGQSVFLRSLPLRFLFGFLCWVILLQWYWMIQKKRKEQDVQEVQPEKQEINNDNKPVESCEAIDKISVKDGGRIHIIKLNDLFCIQACGDYVTLFTPSGQFIKEQTMKHFEKHLPSDFVRIHRSAIVNTNYIMRVELYGKESYHIRLKNGTSLRASGSGYKLLKERLNL
ncbi:MAG: LytTR family transcriptional regulator [Tannerellaceae bacterium]|jgi:hypothetical protein|nr:LytTR family transcriptional regulator [Tannerellaceae bacterium]